MHRRPARLADRAERGAGRDRAHRRGRHPAVGELVLVQFVGGDINAPMITGRLYNDEDRPPENEDGKAVLHLPLGAGDSDAVHVELRAATRASCTLKLGTGLELTLRDDDPAVRLDVGGKAKAVLEIERDGARRGSRAGRRSS